MFGNGAMAVTEWANKIAACVICHTAGRRRLATPRSTDYTSGDSASAPLRTAWLPLDQVPPLPPALQQVRRHSMEMCMMVSTVMTLRLTLLREVTLQAMRTVEARTWMRS